MKCPKCNTENPDTSRFCADCGTQLLPSKEIPVTETLETPKEELTTGSIFAGRYQIIEDLGKGGMGKVYKVHDTEINEHVALKLLKPEIAADEKIIERFRNELKIARKVSHKRVCRMYDIGKEEEKYYITMEYVEGENLKSLIRKKGKLPENEVLRLAKQICEGLAEAHELGIVHRDLKPQNIMIDKEGNAKIMDFGIARSVEAPGVTQTGVMIGTPDYISPEQAEGADTDNRSDIYALGVILFEMVTGSVPFKGDTALSVALKHKAQLPKEPKKLNPEVSEDMSRLILICMEKDRERRYQKAKELLDDLKNIEEGFPLGTKIKPRRKTIVATLIQKKIFFPALIVALAIIALVVWQLFLLKGTIAIQEEKPSLAILYFDNLSNDKSLDAWENGLTELLIIKIAQSKFINVLDGITVYSTLKKLNLDETKKYTKEDLIKVASEGGATHTLSGTIMKAGQNIIFTLTLQKPQEDEIISSIPVECKGEEEIIPKVDEVAGKIKLDLDLSPEQISGDIDEEIGKIMTSSPEAWRYYAEGRKFFKKGDHRMSIKMMKKAVELDPKFAMAYRSMDVSYGTYLGDYYQRNLNRKRALEFSDHLSLRERLLIQARSERDRGGKIRLYKEVLKNYPDDEVANINLGAIYADQEEWDKAYLCNELLIKKKVKSKTVYGNQAEVLMSQGMYDKARKLLVNYMKEFDTNSQYKGLAVISFCQGEYDRALQEVEKYLSLIPDDIQILCLKGDIYLLKGDFGKAEESYKQILEKEDQVDHLWARERLNWLLMKQGKFHKAIEQVELGIDLADRLQQKRWKSKFRDDYLGYLFKRTGQPDLALKRVGVLFEKGLIYLEMKSTKEAEVVLEELRKMSTEKADKRQQRLLDHLAGMIELERGNFSNAIAHFKRIIFGLPYQTWWYYSFNDHARVLEPLASAYYKAGDLEKARETYEQIGSLTAGRLRYGDIYAKSFFMLGKIFEEQGKRRKAIENYEKFLSLWKDADSGIVEVEDAKKRLAGLRSQ